MCDKSTLIDLYRQMRRIRLTEKIIADNYYNEVREMHTPIHLYDGQEAIAIGVCANLAKEDMVFSNHRSHGHYLAKGGDLDALIAELHGKITGCCHGKGGSMHLCELESGIMLTSAIVAGNVSIATGYAMAQKLQKKSSISVVFFGDGASEEGSVYESICFAAQHQLPILYVCENNRVAISTPFRLREPGENVAYKFENLLPTCIIDGNDTSTVYETSNEIICKIREGKGPQFIECHTYRLRAHSNIGNGVDGKYRTEDEVFDAQANDPCISLSNILVSEGIISAEALKTIDNGIIEEVECAFKKARIAALPHIEDLYTDIYA